MASSGRCPLTQSLSWMLDLVSCARGRRSARETYDVVIHEGVAWLAGKDAVRRYDVRSAKRRGALIDVGVSTLAAGDGGVWGADGSDVMRLDGGVRKRIKLAIEPGEMAVSAGLVWVVDELEGDLAILDATTGQVLAARVKVASKIGSDHGSTAPACGSRTTRGPSSFA